MMICGFMISLRESLGEGQLLLPVTFSLLKYLLAGVPSLLESLLSPHGLGHCASQ